jgi:hypothetical protein
MSIFCAITSDFYRPHERKLRTVEWAPNLRLSDLAPVGSEGSCLYWLNGRMVHDPEKRLVRNRDFAQVVVVPGFEAFLALSTLQKILAVGAILAASAAVSKALVGSLAPPVVDPDGSANNGFSGFRNTYEQGGVMPVVFGRHRVAGVCIGQEITASSGNGLLSQAESVKLTYAMSEGPVRGFGKYLGAVANEGDKNALLTALGGLVAEGMQLQINGQPASNFSAVAVNWRTGEDTQTALAGHDGTTQTISIEQALEYVENIDGITFQPGVYDLSSHLQPTASGDSVQYQLTDQYDRVTVQFLFTQGLFKSGGSGSIPSEARFRIQYWATDSGGVPIDDTVVLPEIIIGGNVQGSTVFDFEFALYAASGYTPGLQTGYYACSTAPPANYLFIESNLSAAVLPSNYQDPTKVSFSLAMWVRPKFFTSSAPNEWLFSHFFGVINLKESFPYTPTSPGSSYGFSLRLVADPTNLYSYLILNTMGGFEAGSNEWRSGNLGTASSIENQWMHVGLVYDANTSGAPTVRMYINGNEMVVNQSDYLPLNRGKFSPARRLNFGRGVNVQTGGDENSTRIDIASIGFFDGVKDAGFFASIAGDVDPVFGYKTGLIQTDEDGLLAGLNVTNFLSSPKLANIAPGLSLSTTDGECFEVSDVTGLFAAPQGDAPISTQDSGVAIKGYYAIEVFRSNPVGDDATDEQNDASVEQLTLHLDQEFEFPQTAVLDVFLSSDDQLNNQRPTITALMYGRLCSVWDGASTSAPTFTSQWTRNNAWIALTMLSNMRFGLGAHFALKKSFDLPSWLRWANHCDEGVEDGWPEQSFYDGTTFTPTGANVYGQVSFKIGIIDSGGNPVGTVPETWAVGKTLGIKAAASAGEPALAGSWVTTTFDGKLEIQSITYADDSAAPDGFIFWATIACAWTPVLPLPTVSSGVTGTVVGFEPRCMFDRVFDQQNAEGWEQVLQVFQAGHAMPIMVGSRIGVFVDKKRPPVGLVTQANCIRNSFELTWTGATDVANSFEVDFLDELANYERTPIQVDHASAQNETDFEGFRKDRVQFQGVTRRSQVVRDAHFRLNQQNELLRAATCEMGLDGIPLYPGDRVKVAHDTPQYGTSGRLLSGAGSIGNFNIYPEAFAANLIQFGGLLDVSKSTLEVAGVPTSQSVDTTYTVTGPFGYGDGELVRNTVRGAGQDNSATGSLGSAGGDAVLEFYDRGLFPDGPLTSVVGTIDTEAWQQTVAVFVKEPSVGASDVVRLGIYVPVNADGSAVDEFFGGTFKWTAGVLASVGTPTNNATVTVQAPGTTGADAGWYRIAVHMKYSDLPGASSIEVGAPWQAVFSPAYWDELGSGTFVGTADDGKGVNFAAYADPLDLSNEVWVHTGTTYAAIGGSVLPPFYGDTDHGAVFSLTSNAADGTTQFVKQTVTIQGAGTTFGGTGTVAGEDITCTVFLRENTATVTRVQLINPSGNRATADLTWSTHGLSVTGSAGASAAVAAVYQNSTTTDSDWYQLDITFNNAAGDSTFDVRVTPSYVATGSTSKSVYLWGIRVHGASDNGTDVNPYPHRGMLLWGVDMHDSYAIQDYLPGTEVALDRDITLVAGNAYELEVRSSLAQASGGGPVRENVPIYPNEVPSSGSTTVTAGTFVRTAASFKTFTPSRGDLYSFGEAGYSTVDMTAVAIDLDPERMTRKVSLVEYKDSVYDLPTLAAVSTPETFLSVAAPLTGGFNVAATALYGNPPHVREASSRGADGSVQYAVIASWQLRSGELGNHIGGMRLHVAEKESLTSVRSKPAQFVADVARRHRSFTIANYPWRPGMSYRVFFQPYGLHGNARPVASCSYYDFTFYGGVARPTFEARIQARAPRGERAVFRVVNQNSNDPMEPSQYEVRVGGWRLGQRITNLIGGQGDMTDELYTGPTNAAGDGAPPIFVRGRLGGGNFGRPTMTRMVAGITGSTTLLDTAFEDDWTDAAGATLSNLQVDADGYLEFTAGSADIGTWTSDQKTLGYARRIYLEFWAELDAVPSTTLEDLDGTPLDDPRFYHWTLEGPISGPEQDGMSLRVLWDHSETDTLSGTFVEFRPGIAFLRSAAFRLEIDRSADTGAQVSIRRAGLRAREVPSYRAAGVPF